MNAVVYWRMWIYASKLDSRLCDGGAALMLDLAVDDRLFVYDRIRFLRMIVLLTINLMMDFSRFGLPLMMSFSLFSLALMVDTSWLALH